jgi:hypothetical protein
MVAQSPLIEVTIDPRPSGRHATDVHPGDDERRSSRRRADATIRAVDPRQLPGGIMRTRPASIATIVIAIGLALTSIGIARQLPYTFGGTATPRRSPPTSGPTARRSRRRSSPCLPRPARRDRDAPHPRRPARAAWLVVLAVAISLSGLAEPAQQGRSSSARSTSSPRSSTHSTSALIALALSAFGETRRTGEEAARNRRRRGAGCHGRRSPELRPPPDAARGAYSCCALNVSQDPGLPLS